MLAGGASQLRPRTYEIVRFFGLDRSFAHPFENLEQGFVATAGKTGCARIIASGRRLRRVSALLGILAPPARFAPALSCLVHGALHHVANLAPESRELVTDIAGDLALQIG